MYILSVICITFIRYHFDEMLDVKLLLSGISTETADSFSIRGVSESTTKWNYNLRMGLVMFR